MIRMGMRYGFYGLVDGSRYEKSVSPEASE